MTTDGQRFIWDVFISHASEDKKLVARPLANLIAASGLKVWFDEGELTLGDSLREQIDHGLANSRFGVLVLSDTFFAKKWPMAELDGLFSLESASEKRLLPVWHEVDAEKIKAHSPILSSRVGVRTSEGVERVRDAIVRSIYAKCFGRRSDQPIFRGKLTKKVLFEAPSGSVFITNTINPDFTPRIAIELQESEMREEVWKRIKVIEGGGCVCYIFRDWAGYRDHMASRSIWAIPNNGLTRR